MPKKHSSSTEAPAEASAPPLTTKPAASELRGDAVAPAAVVDPVDPTAQLETDSSPSTAGRTALPIPSDSPPA